MLLSTGRCAMAVMLVTMASVAGFSQQADQGASNGETKRRDVSVARGKVRFQVPEAWESKQPRMKMIESEFTIPSAKDSNEAPGRLTVMAAMGSVEQNLARWQGQFQQPDGKPTKDRTTSKQIKVDQLDVQFVDISGTYQDRPGPFAPAVSRENYRMLAAILPTKKYGQYFFKLYGPQKTIASSEKDFQKMIESFEVDD